MNCIQSDKKNYLRSSPTLIRIRKNGSQLHSSPGDIQRVPATAPTSTLTDGTVERRCLTGCCFSYETVWAKAPATPPQSRLMWLFRTRTSGLSEEGRPSSSGKCFRPRLFRVPKVKNERPGRTQDQIRDRILFFSPLSGVSLRFWYTHPLHYIQQPPFLVFGSSNVNFTFTNTLTTAPSSKPAFISKISLCMFPSLFLCLTRTDHVLLVIQPLLSPPYQSWKWKLTCIRSHSNKCWSETSVKARDSFL